MRRFLLAPVLVAGLIAVSLAYAAPPGAVNQRGDGWPKMTGMLLMNADHASRPLDARIGRDPFMGTDRKYSCDGKHKQGPCHRFLEKCEDGEGGRCVKDKRVHNKLLGGHGNDVIYAGPAGDVLWADFMPNGPARQKDKLYGGPGKDFIYGGPGKNVIKAGRGNDFVKSRYGRGRIDCGKGNDILYTSRRFRHRYKITGCERKSTGPSPGQGGTPIN